MVTAKAEIFNKTALELQKAQTELQKAETARTLVSLGILRPAGVRKQLVKDNYWLLQANA